MATDLWKFLDLCAGVGALSMSATLGVYAVCKIARWAPVNINVTVIQREPDE